MVENDENGYWPNNMLLILVCSVCFLAGSVLNKICYDFLPMCVEEGSTLLRLTSSKD